MATKTKGMTVQQLKRHAITRVRMSNRPEVWQAWCIDRINKARRKGELVDRLKAIDPYRLFTDSFFFGV